MPLSSQPSSPLSCIKRAVPLLLVCLLAAALSARAQTGGEGALQGSVLDATGATVPGATVTATNDATGVSISRTSTSAGFYSITPLIPGTYTVIVTAQGFQGFKQTGLVIDPLHVTGLNIPLKVGVASDTVTVTDAPIPLDTTDAQLGGTISNATYTALPIMLQTGGASSQQRDITVFSNLLPGAQVPPGGRSSIIGGTSQRLGEVYFDGLPLTTPGGQADNRPIYNAVPLEAIDQVQVVTSGFSAEYQGAGLENYSTKHGTNKYHGSVFEYVRNTVFDAWTFTAKPGGGNTVTQITTTGTCPAGTTAGATPGVCTGPGPKTPEHENEYGIAIGGPASIPHLFNAHDKAFFFATYDKFHATSGVNYVPTTVPTLLMRKGDFRELCPADPTTGCLGNASNVNYKIYDPTTQATCTAHNGGTPCRYQYGYGPGAGTTPVLTGAPVNVIPANEISPITTQMASFLPQPTNPNAGNIVNNYLGGTPTGFDNFLYSARLDYVLSDKDRMNAVLTGGRRRPIPYTGSTGLPLPYLSSNITVTIGHLFEFEEDHTFTQHLVNQFKYGYIYFGGPAKAATNGDPKYSAAGFGITGLPAGQAQADFPNTTFSGNSAPTGWVGNNPSSTSNSQNFEVVDNVQFVKGGHAMNFGVQYQWLELNADTQDTGSYQIPITWSSNDTANVSSASAFTANTGYSYASFLLGAVNSSSVTQQSFSTFGSRFHNFSPWFQDDWKITPTFTLNLGLRWDYMPSNREVLDRMSFLNPNITNPVTGNAGALQFAGNYGGAGVSCNCHNPVKTWYKNFGPRASFAWSMDSKTVMRGGYALLYGHAGGTGGANGNNGTGSTGFTTTTNPPVPDSAGTGPSFYLNSNPAFSAMNSNWGGPGFSVPGQPAINATSQALLTGFYACSGQTFAPCNGSTTAFATGQTIGYADPYLGDRTPEVSFYNFGMERQVTNDITVSANYVGTQSHFLTGGSRGLYSNQLDPAYLVSVGNTNLIKAATTANLASVSASTGVALAAPYASYTAAAALNSTANIAHMLVWKPQYASVTDTYGDTANANYNAFQLSLSQRPHKGLSYTVNYTYSRNIDDSGTQRSGYAIPAAATSDHRAWAQNRIDRSLSVNNLPELLTVFSVYKLPFGKGGFAAKNRVVSAVAGGWQISEIYQYASGLPLLIVGSAAATAQNTGQGTYMPDFNPNFHGSPRINGKWGAGVTAATLGTKNYLAGYIPKTDAGQGTDSSTGATASGTVNAVPCASSVGPFCNTQNNTIGNITRVAPDGLRGPNVYRLTMALSRTFDITDRYKFVFRVDCQNVTNHTTFGNNAQNNTIGVNINSSAFGTLGGASADPRAFQFSGRINF
jgi:hypothetical protein